ncbi:hypothetical protein GCM10018782_65780 [Streptomyces griseoaurantiacus]|nr:hypothetical protein GCM10020241_38810 [Streptoalloteichus tenebrarius]GHE87416.1 hypothetical protein GCM10018782_65780 [Streptomyces griseoaurantiacus]
MALIRERLEQHLRHPARVRDTPVGSHPFPDPFPLPLVGKAGISDRDRRTAGEFAHVRATDSDWSAHRTGL